MWGNFLGTWMIETKVEKLKRIKTFWEACSCKIKIINYHVHLKKMQIKASAHGAKIKTNA